VSSELPASAPLLVSPGQTVHLHMLAQKSKPSSPSTAIFLARFRSVRDKHLAQFIQYRHWTFFDCLPLSPPPNWRAINGSDIVMLVLDNKCRRQIR
jgi:hypothetical protein